MPYALPASKATALKYIEYTKPTSLHLHQCKNILCKAKTEIKCHYNIKLHMLHHVPVWQQSDQTEATPSTPITQ